MHAKIFPQTDKLTDKIAAMLWRHYHRAVTQRRTAEFWKIEPPKVDGKTIRFVAV
jgi:hypothetical protein